MTVSTSRRTLRALLVVEVLAAALGAYFSIVLWVLATGPDYQLEASANDHSVVPPLVATAVTLVLVAAVVGTARRLRRGGPAEGAAPPA
ncbi:MAG: hypothetical protein KY443_04890 [Actinobacteria bacterium]|nr:hypothetical protein [Actinomycetota bacterium]